MLLRFGLGLAALLFTVPSWSDTITSTVVTSSASNAFAYCWPVNTCAPLTFVVPQFNGAGTLSEIDWSLNAMLTEAYGWNDQGDPQFGAPWQATLNAGLASFTFGMDTSNSTTLNGRASSRGEISYNQYKWMTSVSDSGADTNPGDLAAFTGDGYLLVTLAPNGSIAFTEADHWIFGQITGFGETGTLSLDYIDPIATPEPAYAQIVASILGILVSYRWVSRRRARNMLDHAGIAACDGAGRASIKR